LYTDDVGLFFVDKFLESIDMLLAMLRASVSVLLIPKVFCSGLKPSAMKRADIKAYLGLKTNQKKKKPRLASSRKG